MVGSSTSDADWIRSALCGSHSAAGSYPGHILPPGKEQED